MSDAMVVARMPREKKESVARRLEALGTNASSAINQLYDYVEQHGSLPFGQDAPQAPDARRRKAEEARAWLDSLQPLPEGNRFQTMTDDQIRSERLCSRGFDVKERS